MKYKCISDKNDAFVKEFLSLPKKLYSKNEIIQNEKTEKMILTQEHPLSKDFNIIPYLVTDDKGHAVSRCILTYYPDSSTAFLGFFEAYNDLTACRLMIDEVCKQAVKDGKTKIVGPIDSSFWIRYRFKADKFDLLPYTCEPYNKDYYISLWEKCGFSECERYFSNCLRQPSANDNNEKCMRRFEMMNKKGYHIENPTYHSFNDKLHEVFTLLIELYSDFPYFTKITWEQFEAMFSGLKYILNYDMAKLVYKDNVLVGFSISVPNYGNAVSGALTLSRATKILREKLNTHEYIPIYMGVAPKHLGLGGFIAEAVKQSLVKHQCSAINALIHDGKVTGNYYNNELSTDRYHYILLEKELT